jgi:hypothetical protein
MVTHALSDPSAPLPAEAAEVLDQALPDIRRAVDHTVERDRGYPLYILEWEDLRTKEYQSLSLATVAKQVGWRVLLVDKYSREVVAAADVEQENEFARRRFRLVGIIGDGEELRCLVKALASAGPTRGDAKIITVPSLNVTAIWHDPRSIREQDRDVENMNMDGVIHGFADVLARTINYPDMAYLTLLRAGFSREQIPVFRSALHFWTTVIEDAIDGKADLVALANEVSRMFPGSPKIREYRDEIAHSREQGFVVSRMNMRRPGSMRRSALRTSPSSSGYTRDARRGHPAEIVELQFDGRSREQDADRFLQRLVGEVRRLVDLGEPSSLLS